MSSDSHLAALEANLEELRVLAARAQDVSLGVERVARHVGARIRALRREQDKSEPCLRAADGRCATHCPEDE